MPALATGEPSCRGQELLVCTADLSAQQQQGNCGQQDCDVDWMPHAGTHHDTQALTIEPEQPHCKRPNDYPKILGRYAPK